MADYNINAVTRRVVFSGSAGVGPYAFTFEILAQTDIAVYKNSTKLVLTTDYTVTINANGTGSVTLVVAATGSDTITIIGSRAIERTTDFVTAGDLLASSLNEQLDSQIVMIQQLAEENKRTIKAPAYDPADVADGGTANLTLPAAADRANQVLAFDASGNPIATEEIGDWKVDWAAATSYANRDLVKDPVTTSIYRCNTAHTSSGSAPISSNADAAKWDLVIDSSDYILKGGDSAVAPDRVLSITQSDSTPDIGHAAVYIDYNSSGSTPVTATRNKIGVWIDMDSTSTSSVSIGTEYNQYGCYVDVNQNATGDGSRVTGYYGIARTTHPSNTAQFLLGGYFVGQSNAAGDVGSIHGVLSYAYNSDSGNCNNLAGHFNIAVMNGSGTVTSAYGTYNEVQIDSGTVNAAYGIRNQVDYNGGTINNPIIMNWNEYAGGDPGVTVYGTYNTGEDINYFSGQVAIGDTTPEPSAALDVASTSKGILFPRMTTAQRDAISSPANGLVIYNTSTNKLQVRAGGAWVDLH